ALPLGGYVKMLGEQEEPLAPEQQARSFSHKPLYQRAAVVAAGPFANFLLAIVLYWGIFLAGVNGLAPVVGDVAPGTPGGASELRAGDEIIAVDGISTQSWQDVRIALLNRMGESGSIRLDLRREDSSLTRSTS